MKLPLAYYGDPILRKKGAYVEIINDEIKQLIQDMEETMFIHEGIGIAAPQIHRSLAIFLTHLPKDLNNNEWVNGVTRVFINPKIVDYSLEEAMEGEGCLSIPGIYGSIYRPIKIKIEATDLNGERFTEEFTHLAARAIMHENDHINGVLFIDRIRGKERQEIEAELRSLKKKHAKLMRK